MKIVTVAFLSFLVLGKANAQEYVVASFTGKVYADNHLLKKADQIQEKTVLTSEKNPCMLRLLEAEKNEDIIFIFKNGHVFQKKILKTAKENELYELTFKELIKEYDSQRYLTSKGVFNWDKYLTEYANNSNRLLILKDQKIPFVPAYEMTKNQQLAVVLYREMDSTEYPLEIRRDSLLIGEVFRNEFASGTSLVRWKLKLKTTQNGRASYEDMSELVVSPLMTQQDLAEEINSLVQMLKSDAVKSPDYYYQSIISSLNFTYGRVDEFMVKKLIDRSL